ncbi:MAG: hypothetical protein HND48_16785 [Chloroflexi bacterium]|nr:hypothetical protein [Chloroflexota bacterium]
MRAVFGHSWELLTPEEQQGFSRLAVFRGRFTRQAGQAVTGATLRQLMTFVNKSLVRRDADSGVYQIHELMRQFAEEQLEAAGEWRLCAPNTAGTISRRSCSCGATCSPTVRL